MPECIHPGLFAPYDFDPDGTAFCFSCLTDVPQVDL